MKTRSLYSSSLPSVAARSIVGVELRVCCQDGRKGDGSRGVWVKVEIETKLGYSKRCPCGKRDGIEVDNKKSRFGYCTVHVHV